MQIGENKAKSQKGRERSQFPVFWDSTSYFCPETGAKGNLTSEDSIVFIFHGVESSLTTQRLLRAQSVCVELDMMFLWKSLQSEKSWEENNCSCSIKILPFPMQRRSKEEAVNQNSQITQTRGKLGQSQHDIQISLFFCLLIIRKIQLCFNLIF